ncbi:MAG TPA: PAS domain S-box protein [Polyangiaceae bacterium]|nr:PAS domain S-box protein [Polyangiaceae bacterium]
MAQSEQGDTQRLRIVVASAATAYLLWWVLVEAMLPGSFNPLGSRLGVVALGAVLVVASRRSRWVERHLSSLFVVWLCVLVAHYSYLLIGNHGSPTWWIGAFITFAAGSMCPEERREVIAFSLVAFACVTLAALVEGQISHAIYLPGLATILLLANVTKHSQLVALSAVREADRARESKREADEQRLRLAAIVESSGDAIVATDLNGRIQSWNRGAERLFGYMASDMVGKDISLLLPSRDHADDPALIERVSRAEAIEPVEIVRRRKDGSLVDLSATCSPIVDSHGGLVGTSMVARDITERKRADAEIRRAREAAETANRELEAFSYSVAHDLRAPLRRIDGFNVALVRDYDSALDDVGRDYLRRVQDSVHEMGRLIDGLLELARVTRVGLHSQQVDLSELARATVQQLKEVEPNRSVECVIHEGFTEEGDRALLGAALQNLLGNAWKFTRKKRDARIEFGSEVEQGKRVYFIRDNGAGFDMRHAARLFGVFQRLHSQRDFEGTGIGLATVQRIVQRHGGRVWAEATLGEGACFHFTLGEAHRSLEAH